MTTPAITGFLGRLAKAPRAVLALDYDGTLAPFRSRPGEAQPYPGVRDVLRRIVSVGSTRLVLVSGRPAADVRTLLAIVPVPEIWGAHGWERLREGRPLEFAPGSGTIAGRLQEARAALGSRGLLALAEWKTASVAVHWRDRPDAKAIEARTRGALAPLVDSAEFEIMPIVAGLEWRCRRHHKGTALETVLSEEAPSVPIAYIGDDETDEDAFRALAGRGLGLRVGTLPVATAASACVSAPTGVLQFLELWFETTAIARRTA